LDVELFYKEVQKLGLLNTIATENSMLTSAEGDESSLLANNNTINLTTKGQEQEQVLLAMLTEDSLGLSFQQDSQNSSMVDRTSNKGVDNSISHQSTN